MKFDAASKEKHACACCKNMAYGYCPCSVPAGDSSGWPVAACFSTNTGRDCFARHCARVPPKRFLVKRDREESPHGPRTSPRHKGKHAPRTGR